MTVLFKFTVVAEIVRSLFEINYHFESKQDRTIYLFEMIENMTVISNLQKRKYPSFEKGWALFISKRKYLYHIERKVNHHLEERANHHLEERVNRHFEVTVHHHFETTANQSFRNDSAASFQNDSFACDKSPINLK